MQSIIEFLKFFLKFIWVVVVVALMFVFIGSAMFIFVDANKYKSIITQAFYQQTGQNIILQGPIKVKIFPSPYAQLQDATLVWKMADAKNTFEISAQEFKVDLNWNFIFSDNVRFKSMELKGATVQYKEAKNKDKTLFIPIEYFKGKLDTTCCDMTFYDFTLKTGEQQFTGKIHLDLTDEATKISGKLATPRWVVGSKTTSFVWPNSVQGKLDVFVGDLVLPGLNMQNTNIDVLFKEKTLEIIPGKIEGHPVTGKIYIDLKDNVTKITGKLATPRWVVGSQTPSFAWPNAMQGKLDVSVGELVLPGLNMQNANIDVLFKERTLEIIPGKIEGKPVSGKLSIQSSEKKRLIVDANLNIAEWAIGQEKSEKKESIKTDWLYQIDGKIVLHIGKLQAQHMQLHDAKLTCDLNETIPKMHLQAKVAQGDLTAQWRMDSKSNARQYFEFSVQNANAQNWLEQFSQNVVLHQGKLDMQFKGSAIGNNMDQWLDNLSGKALIQLHNAILLKRLDARYVNFLSAFFTSFQPKQHQTNLECAVFRFDVQNGVARSQEGLGLQTGDLYILGGGMVDFKSEQVDFTFTLSAREQMSLVGSYNNVVYIKGSLDHPEVGGSAAPIIQGAGSIGLGYLTGGISLLAEKILKIATQKGSPCKQVLQGAQ